MRASLSAVSGFTLLLGVLTVPGCAFVVADLNPFASRPQALEEHVVEGEGRAKILVVDVSHVISDEERDGALGLGKEESVVARTTEELRQAADDDRVKAVVLRINSPGGTVTASDTLYHVVRDFAAKKQVPVVAQMLENNRNFWKDYTFKSRFGKFNFPQIRFLYFNPSRPKEDILH